MTAGAPHEDWHCLDDKPIWPFFTWFANARQAPGATTRAGPSGSLVSRTATAPGSAPTSMQPPLLPLWLLLRHVAWIRSAFTCCSPVS
jgi:hypothetical protein